MYHVILARLLTISIKFQIKPKGGGETAQDAALKPANLKTFSSPHFPAENQLCSYSYFSLVFLLIVPLLDKIMTPEKNLQHSRFLKNGTREMELKALENYRICSYGEIQPAVLTCIPLSAQMIQFFFRNSEFTALVLFCIMLPPLL